MTVFDSVENFLKDAEESRLPLWEYIRTASAVEIGRLRAASWEMMVERLNAMRDADASYCGSLRSKSGLVGGDGEKMRAYTQAGSSITGEFMGEVISAALRMGECNACMHRIVAAPTAGACGVIPAVLLPYAKRFQTPDDELVKALYITAGFGSVIANRASISGAEAGCQAEIGSASAMAATALVYLRGGTPRQMAHACAMALKNLMGLVCDPVAGLVEVPCVKRNVVGAVNALSAAEMALAGIESRIPADEVIDAMREVGESMPVALRETGKGGVANTPTARTFQKHLK